MSQKTPNFALRMSVAKQYIIQLTGTRDLVDEYDYQLDNSFFEAQGSDLASGGDVQAHISIVRHTDGATLAVSLNGSVTVACDRCLAPMKVGIAADETLKVIYGDHFEDDGEAVTIDEHKGWIDLANILFEFIVLQIPIQHVHDEGECDENMQNVLKQYVVTD